eukprot:scaffold220539_cov23-Prasinocladus_malaysianus.AAC.1
MALLLPLLLTISMMIPFWRCSEQPNDHARSDETMCVEHGRQQHDQVESHRHTHARRFARGLVIIVVTAVLTCYSLSG